MSTDRPTVVVVRGRRRPHEVMLLFASLVFAMAWLFGLPAPASLGQLAALGLAGFFVFSGLGAVVGLVGIFAPLPPSPAMALEQAGNWFLAAAGVIYVSVVLALSGLRAWLVIVLIGAVWVAGSVWRAWQIGRELKEMRSGG